MLVYHLSAECFPVAKVGGLADVVGALPKYLVSAGIDARVVMPYYDRTFAHEHQFEEVYRNTIYSANTPYTYTIIKEKNDVLGFPLYLVHIGGLLDRPNIYSYDDEIQQFVAFQLAFLDWMLGSSEKPDIIHCHDHHTGLVPFLTQHSPTFIPLKDIPTVLTIHNGQYQGIFGWDRIGLLQDIFLHDAGLLDWNNAINSLAAAVKCAWKYTAVSPGYMQELEYQSNGLESLFASEKHKGKGIINGIDTDVWNPKTDKALPVKYSPASVVRGKNAAKKELCQTFDLDPETPLFIFIGRLVGEKGADLLPEIFWQTLARLEGKLSILVLGSGESHVESSLLALGEAFKGNYNTYIGYNEQLAHLMYAGADFLFMPSRVEPCGLNQLYALRYGTIPIVRSTGGLKDTVTDISDPEGCGIRFDNLSVYDGCLALNRAVELYANTKALRALFKRNMTLDFSWDTSAKQYIELYNSLT